MDRYHWNILRWKTLVEVSAEDRHKIYFSGKEDGHEYGSALHGECSLRLPTSLQQTNLNPLESSSFNITIIQVYEPISGHDDNMVDNFYQQLHEIIGQRPKKDILVVQGDWNAKVGWDA